MHDKAALGDLGEELACGYLRQHEYTIRDRNWRSGRTEIDIIAENSEFIVFVEVKSRSAGYQVHPAEAVNVPKQRTIIYAASNYIERNGIAKEARFDIITVIFDDPVPGIDHIENAFYPTL
ncbi:MAG: YraN family protein [Bacteroidales bacterium]|nr:YraN family protein [Bacteroidales bacterium]MDT8373778.1 YraN family protein [Bacteroidales bacterium]